MDHTFSCSLVSQYHTELPTLLLFEASTSHSSIAVWLLLFLKSSAESSAQRFGAAARWRDD
jgi:hypothetical protein